jgi:hypothetical protein
MGDSGELSAVRESKGELSFSEFQAVRQRKEAAAAGGSGEGVKSSMKQRSKKRSSVKKRVKIEKSGKGGSSSGSSKRSGKATDSGEDDDDDVDAAPPPVRRVFHGRSLSARIGRFVESQELQLVICVLIAVDIASAVTQMFLEGGVLLRGSDAAAGLQHLLEYMSAFVMLAFIMELILLIFAFGKGVFDHAGYGVCVCVCVCDCACVGAVLL